VCGPRFRGGPLGRDFFSPNTDTQIRKRRFSISAKEKKLRTEENRLSCICFVRKLISLDLGRSVPIPTLLAFRFPRVLTT
jgi:hypothetical protein